MSQAPLGRKQWLLDLKLLRGKLNHAWVSDTLPPGWLRWPVETHSMDQYLHHKAQVWKAHASPDPDVGAVQVVAGAAQEGQQSKAAG